MPKPYHTPRSERDDARGQEIMREQMNEIERIARDRIPYDDPRCKCSMHDALRYWYTPGCPVHNPRNPS